MEDYFDDIDDECFLELNTHSLEDKAPVSKTPVPKIPKQKSLLQFFKGTTTISTKISNPNAKESYHTIDQEAIKTYIYPINYPLRDYQFSISRTALFRNTLVCLPTGLGKTFIAAVVMFNFYRWFPDGKVVFLAPTKPLVAQQIDACYQITGILKVF